MTATLTGDKAIDAMLRDLDKKEIPKAVRKGTRAGAKIVKEAAERNVRIDTGTLHDTLTVRTAKGRGGKRLPKGVIGHAVTHRETGAEDPFYARFVEFGTQKWEGDRYQRIALYDNERQIIKANQVAVKEAAETIAKKTRNKTRG